jgi:DHA1 family bicyclomycin/chloramphenicol resistance-like MFS transporter
LLKLALLLGLLSVIEPFAIDMYLPAIGYSLEATQLLDDSLPKMFGPKPLLYAGLALFALARIGCAVVSIRLTLGGGRFAPSGERAS